MSDFSTITIPKKDLSGSRLRCLMLTSLPRHQVAATLSSLVSPFACVDDTRHHWKPGGLLDPEEAKLGDCEALLTAEIREELTSWWLKSRRMANTPNWDMVSTCTVDGVEGLVLIEAKAHDAEARREGKKPGNIENDQQIDAAIAEASAAFNETGEGWALTRDSHYQLCNRFAWSWKIASLGIPVILVYLGFLNADEMEKVGRPFATAAAWRDHVLSHASGLVPSDAWDKRLEVGHTPMWALIRSLDCRWTMNGVAD